jgi:hypothetical protein
MTSNENLGYANGYVKGMMIEMHRNATSESEAKAFRHCIHVSDLFFLLRGHRDVSEISENIYRLGDRLAQGQTLTMDRDALGGVAYFTLYADGETVMINTDRDMLQQIVDYSKKNELC